MEPGRAGKGPGRVPRHVHISALLLSALCAACSASTVHTRFDGERAYADVAAIVSFGPRPPGSQALERTREYIRSQMAGAGVILREYPFTAQTPNGPVKMNNLVAEIPGTLPEIIVIGNHYDTKLFTDFEFVGANDAGSTTAWMIEFARAVGPRREGHTLWLCWFDGEESFGEWSETDGIYGSRDFVGRLQAEGRLGEIRAMINVDMIGDCSLDIQRDKGAPPWLAGIIWDAAARTGNRRHFPPRAISIEDDHTPFRDAGIPALELIDFNYGGGAVEHQMNWHTSRDRLDLVCPESLQVVGDVILTALPVLDDALQAETAGE